MKIRLRSAILFVIAGAQLVLGTGCSSLAETDRSRVNREHHLSGRTSVVRPYSARSGITDTSASGGGGCSVCAH